jgi:hypothetical protein
MKTQTHLAQRLWLIIVLVMALSPWSMGSAQAAGSSAGAVRILCENQVFDGYRDKLFVLNSAVDRDPSIQKVIRNCTFRNSNQPAIVISDAQNVLIENNTFENLRSGRPGVDLSSIGIGGRYVADKIVIRGNTFRFIGSDGIHIGANGSNVMELTIEDNLFIGSATVGENGVDVKATTGPILIRRNTFQGFRPCESPSQGGAQDCSGSRGVGLVIHSGDSGGVSNRVIVKRNRFVDNIYGLVVSHGARNIVVRYNEFTNNVSIGLEAHDVFDIEVSENTFNNNPTQIRVTNSPVSGGSCTVSGNVFLGDGVRTEYRNARCSG